MYMREGYTPEGATEKNVFAVYQKKKPPVKYLGRRTRELKQEVCDERDGWYQG
jgi:hypothetical protein